MKSFSLIATSLFLIAAVFSSNLYAAEHEIKMLNSGKDGSMVFEPGSLKVAVGDTVKFIATDSGHNTASYFTPEGGATWKGETDEEVSVTIDKEGVYVYVCDPHKVMAMVGVIYTEKATNKEAAIKATKELSSTFVMAKDRLDNFLAEIGSASKEGGEEKKTEEKKEKAEAT